MSMLWDMGVRTCSVLFASLPESVFRLSCTDHTHLGGGSSCRHWVGRVGREGGRAFCNNIVRISFRIFRVIRLESAAKTLSKSCNHVFSEVQNKCTPTGLTRQNPVIQIQFNLCDPIVSDPICPAPILGVAGGQQLFVASSFWRGHLVAPYSAIPRDYHLVALPVIFPLPPISLHPALPLGVKFDKIRPHWTTTRDKTLQYREPSPLNFFILRQKKSTNPNFWVRISSGGTGRPRERVGISKSSVCPSKLSKTRLLGGTSEDFCRDIPRVPEKFENTKLVFSSCPLFPGGSLSVFSRLSL